MFWYNCTIAVQLALAYPKWIALVLCMLWCCATCTASCNNMYVRACLYTPVFRSENIVHLVFFPFVRWLHYIRTWWFKGTLDWSEFTLLHELFCTIATDRRTHSTLTLLQLPAAEQWQRVLKLGSSFFLWPEDTDSQISDEPHQVWLRGQVLNPCMLEPSTGWMCSSSTSPLSIFTAGSIWVETLICCQSHA